MGKRAPLGVVILIVGVLVAYFAHQKVAEYDQGVGLLKKTFSEEHADKAAGYQTMQLAGIIAAAAGGILLLTAGVGKKS